MLILQICYGKRVQSGLMKHSKNIMEFGDEAGAEEVIFEIHRSLKMIIRGLKKIPLASKYTKAKCGKKEWIRC